MSAATGEILALVSDLIFDSKISATAKLAGISVRTFRSVANLRAALHDFATPPRALILDLQVETQDTLALIRAAKAEIPAGRVFAFLPHVEKELAQQARAAGADEVMPRSRFAAELAEILQRLGMP